MTTKKPTKSLDQMTSWERDQWIKEQQLQYDSGKVSDFTPGLGERIKNKLRLPEAPPEVQRIERRKR